MGRREDCDKNLPVLQNKSRHHLHVHLSLHLDPGLHLLLSLADISDKSEHANACGPPASRHVPHHYCLHEAEGRTGAKDGILGDDKLASCNSYQQHLSPRFNLLLDISVSIGSQNEFRKYIFAFVQHNLVRYEQHEDYQKIIHRTS